MKSVTALFAALGVLGIGSISVPAQQLTGSPSATPFSGQGGTNRTLSKSASSNEMLTGVEIAERSDDPCFLRAKFRNIATGAAGSSLTFAACSDNNDNEGTSDSRVTVQVPPYGFTTGARICLNADRDKMKGIQLIARYDDCVLGKGAVEVSRSSCDMLQQSGHEYNLCSKDLPATPIILKCSSQSTDLRRSHFERTNCPGTKRGPDQDWATEVSCPDGMVATGIKLSTRSGGGRRTMIDGVALDCLQLSSP